MLELAEASAGRPKNLESLLSGSFLEMCLLSLANLAMVLLSAILSGLLAGRGDLLWAAPRGVCVVPRGGTERRERCGVEQPTGPGAKSGTWASSMRGGGGGDRGGGSSGGKGGGCCKCGKCGRCGGGISSRATGGTPGTLLIIRALRAFLAMYSLFLPLLFLMLMYFFLRLAIVSSCRCGQPFIFFPHYDDDDAVWTTPLTGLSSLERQRIVSL